MRKELVLSILAHLIIVLYLSFQYFESSPKTAIYKVPTTKPIQSFLYNSPTLEIIEKDVNTPKIDVTPVVKSKNKIITSPELVTSIKKKNINKGANTFIDLSKKNIKVHKPITKQSLQDQINNINKKRIIEAPVLNQNYSIKSVFNPEPTLVPKSYTKTFTQQENERQQKITKYGDSSSITKGDNGICSITQNLSSVGMSGLSSTQYFKCGGKTKKERIFSQHMKEKMKHFK